MAWPYDDQETDPLVIADKPRPTGEVVQQADLQQSPDEAPTPTTDVDAFARGVPPAAPQEAAAAPATAQTSVQPPPPPQQAEQTNPAAQMAQNEDAYTPAQIPEPTIYHPVAANPQVEQQRMADEQAKAQKMQADAQKQENKRVSDTVRNLKSQGVEMETDLETGTQHPKVDDQGRVIFKPAVTSPFEDRGDGNYVSVHRDRFGNEQDVPLKPKLDLATGERYVTSADGVSRFSLGVDQDFILRRDAIQTGKIATQARAELGQVKQQQNDLSNQIVDLGIKASALQAKPNLTDDDRVMVKQYQQQRDQAVQQLKTLDDVHAAKSAEAEQANTDFLAKRKLITDKIAAQIAQRNGTAPTGNATPAATPENAPDPATEAKRLLGVIDTKASPSNAIIAKALASDDPQKQARAIKAAQSIEQMSKPTDNGVNAWQDFGMRVLAKNSENINRALEGITRLVGWKSAAEHYQENAETSRDAVGSGSNLANASRANSVEAAVADATGVILSTVPATTITAAALPEAVGAGAVSLLAKAGLVGLRMIPIATQFAAQASAEAHDAVKQQGGTDDAATAAAGKAAVNTLKALPAYALGGTVAGKIEQRLSPTINPILKGATHFMLNGAANMMASFGLRAVEGEPLRPTLKGTAQDLAFALQGAATTTIAQSRAMAAIPAARGVVAGTEPNYAAMVKMAADPNVDPKIRATAQQNADNMQKNAQAFLTHMGLAGPADPAHPDEAPAPEGNDDEIMGALKNEIGVKRQDLQNERDIAQAAIDDPATPIDQKSDHIAKVAALDDQLSKLPQVEPEKPVASVPVMVTKTMEKQLGDLGYSQAEIDAMKPTEAHAAIARGPKPAPQTQNEPVNEQLPAVSTNEPQPAAPGTSGSADNRPVPNATEAQAPVQPGPEGQAPDVRQGQAAQPPVPGATGAAAAAATTPGAPSGPAGGSAPASAGSGSGQHVVLPGVKRVAGRDIVRVRMPDGSIQPFYRSTGQSSGMPGKWLPFDGIKTQEDGSPHFLKGRFTEPGTQKRTPHLYRYGTEEHRAAGEMLDNTSIPEGTETTDHEGVNSWLRENPKQPPFKVQHKEFPKPGYTAIDSKGEAGAPVAKPPEPKSPKGDAGAAAVAPKPEPPENLSAIAKANGAKYKGDMQHGGTVLHTFTDLANTGKETDFAVPQGATPAEFATKLAQARARMGGGPPVKPAPTVDAAAHEAATSPLNEKKTPSLAQHEADNAKLGHDSIGGMPISFENPAGSIRTNIDMARVKMYATAPTEEAGGERRLARQILEAYNNGDATAVAHLGNILKAKHGDLMKPGKQWATKMLAHYGRFKGTVGKDGDHLDAYVKPGTPKDWNGRVIVINQKKADGSFDEHKVMVGYDSMAEATKAYAAHYDIPAHELIHSAVGMSWDHFKRWAKSGDLTKPATGVEQLPAQEPGRLPTEPKAEAPLLTPAQLQEQRKNTPLNVTPGQVTEARGHLLKAIGSQGVIGKLVGTGVVKVLPADAPRRGGSGFDTDPKTGQITVHTGELADALSYIEGDQAKADFVAGALDHEVNHHVTLKSSTRAEIEAVGNSLTPEERSALETTHQTKYEDPFAAGVEAISFFSQAEKGKNAEAFQLFTDKAKNEPGFKAAIVKWLDYAKQLARGITGKLSDRLAESIKRMEAAKAEIDAEPTEPEQQRGPPTADTTGTSQHPLPLSDRPIEHGASPETVAKLAKLFGPELKDTGLAAPGPAPTIKELAIAKRIEAGDSPEKVARDYAMPVAKVESLYDRVTRALKPGPKPFEPSLAAPGPQPARKQTETPEFRNWFGQSKVVDSNGEPLIAKHGAARPDRIGNVFRKSRATSGPMAFFTTGENSGDVASGYAKGKADTSFEGHQDYADWFKIKPKGARTEMSIDRSWWYMTPEQRKLATERLYTTGYQDYENGEGPIVPDSQSIMGKDSIDYELKQARGNALKAASEIWLNSGSLFNDESQFLDVLKGMGVNGARLDDPHRNEAAVFPTYLKIENPLHTKDIPPSVIDALQKSANRQRPPKKGIGSDAWDKNTRDPQEWMTALRENGTHAWTSIPDWVTRTLKGLGYDGIHDDGGKYHDAKHDVWIPFEETQVKSAIGNRGTFDPTKKNFLHAPGPEPAAQSEIPEDRRAAFTELAAQLRSEGVTTPEKVSALLQEIGNGRLGQYADSLHKLVSPPSADTPIATGGARPSGTGELHDTVSVVKKATGLVGKDELKRRADQLIQEQTATENYSDRDPRHSVDSLAMEDAARLTANGKWETRVGATPETVEAGKPEAAAAKKLAAAPDTAPAKLKVQKAYLLDALDKAIETAPEHVTSAEHDEDIRRIRNSTQWNGESRPTAEDAVASLPDLSAKYGTENLRIQTPADQPWLNAEGKAVFGTGQERGEPAQDREATAEEHHGELMVRAKAAREAALPHIQIEVPGDGTFTIVNSKEALQQFRDGAKKRFPTVTAQPERVGGNLRATETKIAALGKPKSAVDFIKIASSVVTKDDTRAVLQNVLSNGKQVVATDGRRLLVIDAKAGGTDASPFHYEPTGKRVKEPSKFPDYNQIIPKEKDQNAIAKIDTASMSKLLAQAIEMTSDRSNSVVLWRDAKGQIGVTSGDPNIGSFAGGSDPETSKRLAAYNPHFLLDGIKAARALGNDEVTLNLDKKEPEMSPAVITAKGMKYVLMPMRISADMSDMSAAKHPLNAPGPEPAKPSPTERVGQPIDDFDGNAPRFDWNATDNYGKWSRDSVAKHLGVPADEHVYRAMVDLNDLKPSRVEQTDAADTRKGSAPVEQSYLDDAEAMLEDYTDEAKNKADPWHARGRKFEDWKDSLPWNPEDGYDQKDVESLAREMQARSEESSYPEEEFQHRSKEGFPPIVVTRTADGTLEVVDGNHRADIWQQQGHDTGPAWVNDEMARGTAPESETPLAAPGPEPTRAAEAPKPERKNALTKVFAGLPEKERTVVSMKMSGKSDGEIASTTGLSEVGVKNAYKIALAKLSKAAKEEAAKATAPPPEPAETPGATIPERIKSAVTNVAKIATGAAKSKPIKDLENMGVLDEATQHVGARSYVPLLVKSMRQEVMGEHFGDEAFEKKVGETIRDDNIIGGYDALKAQRAELEAKPERTAQETRELNNLGERISEIEQAQDIGALDNSVSEAAKDPEVRAAIGRYEQVVTPEMDKLYNEMKGVDPATERDTRGRHFNARVNLLSKENEGRMKDFADPDKPMPEMSASSYRNPDVKRDKFDRRAKYTGEYSGDLGMMLTNSFGGRVNEATKQRLYNALVDGGKARILRSGETPPETMAGEPAAVLQIKRPQTINGTTQRVEERMVVPRSRVETLRRVLNTDLAVNQNPVLRALTKTQILGVADATAHTKNQISVVTNTLGRDSNFKAVAARIPILGTLQSFAEIRSVANEVAKGGPEITKEEAALAKYGMLRNSYGDASGWKKYLPSSFLHENDVAARIILARRFDNLVKDPMFKALDTIENKRNFIMQIGEYNRRLMSAMESNLRDYGASPFIVAGKTFNRFGRRLVAGEPGFDSKSAAAGIYARTAMLTPLLAGMATTVFANMMLSGNAFGRKGTPIGAIDLGPGYDDDKGERKMIDLFQISGIRRGLRGIGLDSLLNSFNSDAKPSEVIGKAISDAFTTSLHPYIGPGAGFLFEAATGKRLDLRQGWQRNFEARKYDGGQQYLENIRAALKHLNVVGYAVAKPAVGVALKAAGMSMPPDKGFGAGIGEAALKSPASAFGYKETSSPAAELAHKIREESAPLAPPDEQQLQKWEDRGEILNQLRQGDYSGVAAEVAAGRMKRSEVPALTRRAMLTPLQRTVFSMTPEQVQRVYAIATPQEQAEIRPLLEKKLRNSAKRQHGKQ